LKGSSMDSEWRTIQMFLDEETPAIYEVQINSTNPRKITCNCKPFLNSSRCKHIRYIKDSMNKNNGHYAIQVPASVTDDDSVSAIETAEEWRDFVVKYAKVIVL
jgi:hypothetical protein